MQYKTVKLYHNIPGSNSTTQPLQSPEFINVAPLTYEEVYAGWDGEYYFTGYLT